MSRCATVHLIRHGDYGLIGRALAGRTVGHSLSDEGRAQAERIAGYLAARPLAIVASGPLERARETAAPSASRLGLPLRTEPRLNEIDFGDWTGLSFDVLHGLAPWHEWNRFRSTVPIPGGETMLAVQARAMAALGAAVAEAEQGEIALFSHADVIKVVIAHCLGMPLDLLPRIEIDCGSRSEIVFYDADLRVKSVNRPSGS